MNYWVVKGSARNNDWDEMLKPGRCWHWVTSRYKNRLSKGDRLFFWQSTPECRVVGLGVIAKPHVGTENGKLKYQVRILTGKLNSSPSIGALREVTALKDATFLKWGAATCIFPLSETEASALFGILQQHNKTIAAIWPEMVVVSRNKFSDQPLDDDLGLPEGGRRLLEHIRRERNPQLVRRKKGSAKTLACECCGIEFERFYGPFGQDICEVHHLIPLGSSKGQRHTRLEDLAIVCPNCHRVIHRAKPMLTVKRLARIIRSRKAPKP